MMFDVKITFLIGSKTFRQKFAVDSDCLMDAKSDAAEIVRQSYPGHRINFTGITCVPVMTRTSV